MARNFIFFFFARLPIHPRPHDCGLTGIHSTNMVTPSSAATATAAPSLNVYKKVAVIRIPSDSLTYEDAEGNQKSVSIDELGDAISSAVRAIPLCTAYL
jgi:hypothetical protein